MSKVCKGDNERSWKGSYNAWYTSGTNHSAWASSSWFAYDIFYVRVMRSMQKQNFWFLPTCLPPRVGSQLRDLSPFCPKNRTSAYILLWQQNKNITCKCRQNVQVKSIMKRKKPLYDGLLFRSQDLVKVLCRTWMNPCYDVLAVVTKGLFGTNCLFPPSDTSSGPHPFVYSAKKCDWTKGECAIYVIQRPAYHGKKTWSGNKKSSIQASINLMLLRVLHTMFRSI